MNPSLVFRILLAVTFLWGCGPQGDSQSGSSTDRELGDHRYSVRLSVPAAWVVAQQDFLEIQVRPKAGRKLSLEFPTRVEIQPDEDFVAPARMDKEAAALLTEEAIDYRVPVQAKTEGQLDLTGTLLVGVCTDELCERVELPFEAALSVSATAP